MELLRVSPRNPRAWKSVVDTLSTFLSEGVFHFTERGVWLQALDPSMIVYVSMEAPRSFFSEYELNHPEVRVPVSLVDFQKILGRLSPGDSLTLSFSSTNLYVIMEGSGIRKEFVLPALDVRESLTPVTLPEGLSLIELPVSYLRDALKNASIVARHVTLKTSPSGLLVEAREGTNVSRTLIAPSPAVKIASDRESVSTYSIEYLQNILKGAEDRVSLEYATDAPVRIKYSNEGIQVTFVLAPLIL
ncbi:MAG: hypothetical protein GXO00_02665 [Candidatus Diapherotrites archaeon]|nr:hypothetical protein [Candidatus Diapherotrites archaeon]